MLKKTLDSVSDLNNFPTGLQAVGIVSTLLWALSTDIFGKRWISGYYVAVTAICVGILLLVPNVPTAGQFAAYYWSGTIYCIQATFFAWANDSMRHQPVALRAVVIACMNFSGNVFQAWWPLIFYRANDAPDFTVSVPRVTLLLALAMKQWKIFVTNFQIERNVCSSRRGCPHGGLGYGDAVHGKAA